MTHSHTFVARLRGAGVEPGDPDELRIKKSIMVFAMGLMTTAPMVWLAEAGNTWHQVERSFSEDWGCWADLSFC